MRKESNQANVLIFILGGVVLLGLVGGVFFFMKRQERRNRLIKVEKAVNREREMISPLPTLSQDDAIGTLKKEVNDTKIDNFSSDLQDIEKDINGL